MKYLILLCLIITGCSPIKKEIKASHEPIHIVVASDLHYLSPQLHDFGERFQLLLENGDGKMVELIEEVSEAFIDQMIEEKPDAVILSGDVSFNGERLSHEDLAKKLHRLKENGINVYLIPGNHDMNSEKGYQFEGAQSQRVESVTEKEFKQIYKEFYEDVISQDKKSLSYVTALREDVWLLMLDVNSKGVSSGFEESSWEWIEKQLKKANEQGKKVISVTHQNAIVHNDAFTWGYVINDNGRLLRLFEQYGVKVNFSGHLHVQSIDFSHQTYDIANSSLAVSPNQYSDVIIDENQRMHVKSQPIRVSEWANKKGLDDERLLNFETYAKQYFLDTNSKKLTNQLDEIDLSTQNREAIRLFASEMNYVYFAGTALNRRDELMQMPGYEAWLACDEGLRFDNYLVNILNEEKINDSISTQL